MLSRLKHVWPYCLAAAVPPIAVAWAISCFAVNVPYMDHWDGFVGPLEAFDSGRLTMSMLWNQHNEHRLVFPKMMQLGLAAASGWNVVWEQYASVAIQAVSFVLCMRIARITITDATGRRLNAFSVIASLLLFSMVQFENWSWGWQLQIFLNILAVTFSAWALTNYPDRWPGLLLAAAGAAVATYSFANGIVAWCVFPAAALLSPPSKKRAFGAAWAGLGAIIVGSYLYGYTSPAHHPGPLTVLRQPLQIPIFVLSYIGAPFGSAFGAAMSAIIGLIGAAAGIYLTIRTVVAAEPAQRRRGLPWIGLVLYSLLSAAATAVGRIGLGVDQSLHSRYSSFAIVYWVALAGLAFSCQPPAAPLQTPRMRSIVRGVFATILAALTVLYGMAYAQGVLSFEDHGERLSRVETMLTYGTAYGAESLYGDLHPFPRRLAGFIETLKRIKAGPYHVISPRPNDIYIHCGAFAPPLPGRPLASGQSGALVMAAGARISFGIEIKRQGYYQVSTENWRGANAGSLSLLIDKTPVVPAAKDALVMGDAPRERFAWKRYAPVYMTAGAHTVHVSNTAAPSLLMTLTLRAAGSQP